MSRYSKTYNRDHYRGIMTKPINLTDVEEALRESTRRMSAALKEIETQGVGLRIDPKDGYSLAPEAKQAVERLLEKHGVSGAVVKRHPAGTFSIMAVPLSHVIGLQDCRCEMCEGGRKEYRRNLGEKIHEAAAQAVAEATTKTVGFDKKLRTFDKSPGNPSGWLGWDVYKDLVAFADREIGKAINGQRPDAVYADEVDKIAPEFKTVSVGYGPSPASRTVGTFVPDTLTQAQRLKLRQHVGKMAYSVSRDTVTVNKMPGDPPPIGVVASVNDDGSCMVRLSSPPSYRSPIMTFKLDAPTEPMALHEAIHRVLNSHEMPDVTGMVPSSIRAIKRLVKVLNGKNKYAQELGTQKAGLQGGLAGLRLAYAGARKEADEAKAKLLDPNDYYARRLAEATKYGAPQPILAGSRDTFGAALQDIWRTIQQARAAVKSPEEIERITTERLTSELKLSLDKGMHQSTDYKPWRSPWCELLHKVNALRTDYQVAQERAINACVVDLNSVLMGHTSAADIPEKMHGGWASKLREVFKLKGEVKDLNRKLDAKIESSSLEVLREAVRLMASKVED